MKRIKVSEAGVDLKKKVNLWVSISSHIIDKSTSTSSLPGIAFIDVNEPHIARIPIYIAGYESCAYREMIYQGRLGWSQ